MSTEVLLPKIGFSMNEGVLTRWLVDDGATVTQGEPLYELESEKSVQEVEAPASEPSTPTESEASPSPSGSAGTP